MLKTPWDINRAFIANIIRTRGTLRKTVGICGTIWTSWSEKESWSSCCTILWPSRVDRFESPRDSSSRPPLRTINVIFAAPSRTSSYPSRVMSVARLSTEDSNSEPKRARIETSLVLGFMADDKIGTIQPHDDALMVTLRIRGTMWKRCW